MADIFRKTVDKRCGRGGVKCSCCNDYHGKARKVPGRAVRRIQALALRKSRKAL